MSRSLRVQQSCINKVKLSLRRNGFTSQRALAEEVGFALATVSNFLTGKPVDYSTFEELCQKLALDWKEVSTLDLEASAQLSAQLSVQIVEKKFETPKLSGAHHTISPCYPSGSVPLDSPFYLERIPIEDQVYQEIRKPGALVRIKAPREMGKTSLLIRMLNAAKCLGYRTVSLNLEQVDQAILSDLNQFLRWLCANIARQLRLQPKLDEYWDEDLGSKISCTSYLEDYLLEASSVPLVLALDEMNQVFEHPQVAKDFLPLLRSWYEEAKTLPVWQKLRLIVAHSTEIYVPLHINQSPFNVGLPIQLNTFSQAEVQQLAQYYGLHWENGSEAKQLMNMVEGHPSLIHIALYHLSRQETTMSQLLKTASTSTGIYNHHLQRHWVTLREQPELAQAFSAVISAMEPVTLAPILAYQLSSLGLIKQSGSKARLGCELYRQAFGTNL